MIYKLFTLSFILLLSIGAMAQQDPILSQYMTNHLVINPAYVDEAAETNILFTQKNQWMGLEGAPKTSALFVNSLLNANMNVGLHLFNDVVGPVKHYGIVGTYGYILQTGPGKLSLGLQLSGSQYKIKWNEVTFKDMSDELVVIADEGKTIIDVNFGAYYTMDKFDAGLSVLHLPESALRTKEYNIDPRAKYKRHYYLFGRYKYDVNEDFALKPSLLLRYVEQGEWSLDVNAYALYRNRYAAGISYRSDKALVFLIEVYAGDKFAIGYSYDYYLNDVSTINVGSSEIHIRLINPFSIFGGGGGATEDIMP